MLAGMLTACRESENKSAQFSRILEQLDPSSSESDRAKAVQSLKDLGTNAYPFLVTEMNSIKWHVPVEKDADTIRRSQRLRSAFQVFGTNLAPLTQEFVANLDTNRDFIGALNGLVVMGGQGFLHITEALTNRETAIRFAAVSAVMTTGQTNLDFMGGVIPILVRLLKDESASVRCIASETLGLYCTESEQCVPALLDRARNDPDVVVRSQAVKAIGKIQGRIGHIDSETRSVLENISTQDQSQIVRSCATQALTGKAP